MVVICDDPDRENEGDVCMAAEFVTAEAIAMMACQARGLICLSLPAGRCDELDLPLMVPANDGSEATAFTVSIDAASGVATSRHLGRRPGAYHQGCDGFGDPSSRSGAPSHIFPLRARRRGLLERRGHTEASVELTRLAGLTPGGVLCEILNEDGTLARGHQVTAFCRKYALPLLAVDDLATYLAEPSR